VSTESELGAVSFANRWLTVLAVVQSSVYALIAWVSRDFAYGSEVLSRPIVAVIALFITNFVLYLFAIWIAVRTPKETLLPWIIIGPAVIFRCLLLPTPPILEVDIYRYLWDGAVTASGENPYSYSPEHVLFVEADTASDDSLQRLIHIRDQSPSLQEVLTRVHYAELPTIYPPVSQAVFLLGDWLTPSSASAEARVVVLKCLLLLFDLGTLGVVWLLLRSVGGHPGWAIAYGWCPLVVKEFANSGHLDSIAVFFTTAAVWCLARIIVQDNRSSTLAHVLASGILLSLGVGAKLYPIVLLPIFLAAIASKKDLKLAACFACFTITLSALLMAPMLLTKPVPPTASETSRQSDLPPLPTTGQETSPLRDPVQPTGLQAFLTRWEMNDFLFLLVFENLKPTNFQTESAAWFSVVPNTWREAVVVPVAMAWEIEVRMTSFLVTRAITLAVFSAILLALAWKTYRRANADQFLQSVFLTLAWFWLLSPTQNPWYWTWALPFLPFAKGKAWFVVSGLLFLYYLRFWLIYHYPEGPILGTAYGGADFFDFVVTWIEFGPWFAWLILGYICRKITSASK